MLPHKPTFQIFFTESNIRYLPKSEAAVHRCLQPFIEKRLFMSIFFTKVAGLQSKKDSAGDIFVKYIWVVTASAKYYSFSLFPRPYLQNVPPDFSFPEQTT